MGRLARLALHTRFSSCTWNSYQLPQNLEKTLFLGIFHFALANRLDCLRQSSIAFELRLILEPGTKSGGFSPAKSSHTLKVNLYPCTCHPFLPRTKCPTRVMPTVPSLSLPYNLDSRPVDS